MSPMTAYKTLKLPEGSSLSTIKKAYRTLALKNHPDRNPDRKGSTSVMQKINSAYETLKKIGSTRKRTPTRYKTPSPKESPKAPPKTSPKAKKGENAWWDNHISNREKVLEELFKETKEGNKKKVEEIINNFNRNTGDNLEGSQDDNGYSPLFYAAEKGHIEIVKYLVELGVSIDAAGYATQKSPLGIAVYNGDIEIVKYLVEKGADINAGDRLGNRALDIARKRKHSEVIGYLERLSGGKSNKRRTRKLRKHLK
jgi:ankyrin repeat protein